MPKRVIDFDALWASDKLASCAEWAQSEYAWLYGLADASGSFELTNLRVIWGRVAAIRKNLTLERLQKIFDEFMARGLLFTWEKNGKRYGHWTGSDVPGRLPRRSWRMRLEKLAPPVPGEALAAYSARFGGTKEMIAAAASAALRSGADVDAPSSGDQAGPAEPEARFTPECEEAHAQDWGLDLEEDLDWEEERTVCLPQRTQVSCSAGALLALEPGTPSTSLSVRKSDRTGSQMRPHGLERSAAEEFAPETLLEIYERERGELPPAGDMSPERRERCERWLAAGFTLQEFTEAVRRAAATPFLAGDSNRGWQASFDWLIANRRNVRKVLAGEYAPHGRRRTRQSGEASSCAERSRAERSRAERHGEAHIYTGLAPRPADCGVRVNPAALERIRAREAQRARARQSAQQRPHQSAQECAQFVAASRGATDRGADRGPDRGADCGPAWYAVPEGVPPQAAKAIAFDAQPRASPAALKS